MKRIHVCIMLFALLFSSVAMAEVKEITIGGTIDLDFIWRNNYEDFDNSKKDQPAYTELELYLPIRAKMTENVSAEIELREGADSNGVDRTNIGFDIDEAFITAGEFLWESHTLTIGKQPVHYTIRTKNCMRSLRRCSKFIFASCEDPLAIVSSFQWESWKADFLWAKYEECSKLGMNNRAQSKTNETGNSSDVDVYAVVVDYTFKEENLLRFVLAHMNDNFSNSSVKNSAGQFQAAGRQMTMPMIGADLFFCDSRLEIYGELGYEFGDYDDEADIDISSFGGYVGLEYTFAHDWKPYLGAEVKYLEGDSGDDAQWQPWYGKQVISLIFEQWKQDHQPLERGGYTRAAVLGGFKKLPHNFYFEVPFCYFWDNDDSADDAYGNNIGAEIDFIVGWHYTEDLKFEFGAGWFFVDNDYAKNGGSKGKNGLNPNAEADDAWTVVFNTTINF